MITRKLAITAAILGCATLTVSSEIAAQDPTIRDKASRIELFDRAESLPGPTSPSDLRRSSPTAAELRQERALYQMRQRIERLEAAAWLGYSPLRPNWSSIPMMSSRYPAQRVIYVPVYYR